MVAFLMEQSQWLVRHGKLRETFRTFHPMPAGTGLTCARLPNEPKFRPATRACHFVLNRMFLHHGSLLEPAVPKE